MVLTHIAPCKRPADPTHGRKRGGDFRHGRFVRFYCHSGYQRVGAASVVCNDGKWNNQVPLCKDKGHDVHLFHIYKKDEDGTEFMNKTSEIDPSLLKGKGNFSFFYYFFFIIILPHRINYK